MERNEEELGTRVKALLPVDAPALAKAAGACVVRLASMESIESLWFVGSVAKGYADRYSDVDMLAVTRADREIPVAETEHALQEALSPVILKSRRCTDSVLFNVVSPEWLRIDVSLYRSDVPMAYREHDAVLVFGSESSPTWNREEQGSSRGTSTAQVEELMRIMGLLPVVLGRENILGGFTGCGLVAIELIRIAGTVSGPGLSSGALSASKGMSQAARDTLSRLPGIAIDRLAIINFHMAAWKALCRLMAAIPLGVLDERLRRTEAALASLYRREFDRDLERLPNQAFSM